MGFGSIDWRTPGASYGNYRGARFRLLAYGAATMLWINHAPSLCAVGGRRKEFYGEVDIETRTIYQPSTPIRASE